MNEYKMIIVGGILEKDGKYLLVQEKKEEVKEKWNIPAGYLHFNEMLIDGAKREILEETGCNVELTGISSIHNIILKDQVLISVLFSTKIIDENISFDKSEISNVKWFSYDELINMKNELRSYDWIIDTIKNIKNNNIADIDLIKVIK